jgi:hypothetical protein
MNGKWKKVFGWLLGITTAALIVFIGMRDSIVRPMNEEKANAVKTDPIDVKEYYKENAEILAEYDAKTSESIQSEKQVSDDLSERGFTQYLVLYEYSIDGTYVKEQVARNNKKQHPIYQTYYISQADEIWTIIVINGQIIANPVSYNMQSERGVQFIVSESNVITGYDSSNNMFYETIPNESTLMVYVVDKINAETLEKLTVEVIRGL